MPVRAGISLHILHESPDKFQHTPRIAADWQLGMTNDLKSTYKLPKRYGGYICIAYFIHLWSCVIIWYHLKSFVVMHVNVATSTWYFMRLCHVLSINLSANRKCLLRPHVVSINLSANRKCFSHLVTPCHMHFCAYSKHCLINHPSRRSLSLIPRCPAMPCEPGLERTEPVETEAGKLHWHRSKITKNK